MHNQHRQSRFDDPTYSQWRGQRPGMGNYPESAGESFGDEDYGRDQRYATRGSSGAYGNGWGEREFSGGRGPGNPPRSFDEGNFGQDYGQGFSSGQNYGQGYGQNYLQSGYGSPSSARSGYGGAGYAQGNGPRAGWSGDRNQNPSFPPGGIGYGMSYSQQRAGMGYGERTNQYGQSYAGLQQSRENLGGAWGPEQPGLGVYGYGGREPGQGERSWQNYGTYSGEGYRQGHFSEPEYAQGYGQNYGAAYAQSGGQHTSGRMRGAAPRNYKRSDERISEHLCESLMNAGLDCSGVDVSVKDGVATITGEVMDRNDKYRIEQLASDVSGITEVDNKLRVSSRRSEHSDGQSRSGAARGSDKASTGNGSSHPTGIGAAATKGATEGAGYATSKK